MRSRKLRDAEASADREAIARRYADFLLSFTGEDEVVFALHHASDDCTPTKYELGDTSVTQSAVYATKQDTSDQECKAFILDANEGYLTTDFALVLGQAPSEALKVRLRKIRESLDGSKDHF